MRELEAIQSERRGILNLFLSVIILGLLLNCIVSAFFGWAGGWLEEYRLLPLLLVVAVIAASLVSYIVIRLVILRPIRESGEYPTLVVVDSKRNEVPLPLLISAARERVLEGGPPPFPILARKLYRLAVRDGGERRTDETTLDPSLDGITEEIVQFAILQWYRHKYWVQWSVGAEYRRVGPCGPSGWYRDRPSHKLPVSELAATGGDQNRFLRLCYSGKDGDFVLPPGMTLKLAPHGAVCSLIFSSDLLDLIIRVTLAGGVGGVYNLATWDRRFAAEPDDMFAYQIMVRYEVSVHEGLHRYVPGRLLDLPLIRRVRPEVAVGELYTWAQGVVDGVKDYLTWYQDEADYIDSEVIEFEGEDDDGRMVYRFREPHVVCESIAF